MIEEKKSIANGDEKMVASVVPTTTTIFVNDYAPYCAIGHFWLKVSTNVASIGADGRDGFARASRYVTQK